MFKDIQTALIIYYGKAGIFWQEIWEICFALCGRSSYFKLSHLLPLLTFLNHKTTPTNHLVGGGEGEVRESPHLKMLIKL